MYMELHICDKVVTKNGLYEIRGLNPLKGYNEFNGAIENILETDIANIPLDTYKELLKMGKENALKKIFDEYPEICL